MVLAAVVLATHLIAGPTDSLSAAEWRGDLRRLVAEIERIHPNPYHRIPKARVDSAVAALDASIPSLSREQIIVEFAKLVALLGDGHTYLAPTSAESGANFGSYPVVYYQFTDGLYVQGTDSASAALLGGRVKRIGRLTADQAMDTVGALVSRENPMWVRRWTPPLLARPEVLRALGIADNQCRVVITIERGGRDTTVELRPSTLGRPNGAGGLIWGERWRRVLPTRTPLWLRHPDAAFWLEHLRDSRTLYVQFNQIADADTESVADFFQRVARFARGRPVDRFVLDLRLNGGGDNTLNAGVIRAVLGSATLSRPDRFFTLIGPTTFSAAQNLANALERYTNTIFIGEPTGSRPNMYGDAVPVTLPRSGLTFHVSTVWWQDLDPRDRRQWTGPAIAAAASADDFRKGRDPALAAALAYNPRQALTARLRAPLVKGDLAEAMRAYQSFIADSAHRYVDTERELEALAISLARDGKLPGAAAVAELNAREHPQSPQAQYVLGEAFRRRGNPTAAAEAYQRALALDPRHAGALQGMREVRPAS
jgi:hypothetical protein